MSVFGEFADCAITMILDLVLLEGWRCPRSAGCNINERLFVRRMGSEEQKRVDDK